MVLTEKDKQIISNHDDSFKPIYLNGYKCYVKPDDDLVEIIGEELAKFIGLECIHYEAVKINNVNYVISLDMNYNGKFKTFDDYLDRDCLYNLYSIWDFIESKFDNCKELMHEITLMYIYDILFMHYDRSFENFGILDDKKLILLDNSLIFKSDLPPLISSMFDVDDISNVYCDLYNYLTASSEEFVEEFMNIFNLVTPDKLDEIFNKIEKERKIKIKKRTEYNDLYKENYEIIKLIINIYRGDTYAR